MDGLFDLEPDNTPRVWNKHHNNAPAEAVFIGRPSPWGNRFIIGEFNMSRNDVIRAYAEYVEENPAFKAAIKRELRGKHLVCFCSPAACHGDVLLSIANED